MKLDLDIGYQKFTLYKNIKFELPEQGIISLIGDNGSGKSTIYKTLMGIIPPIRGKVSDEIIKKCAIVSDYVHIPEENKVKDVLKLCEHLEINREKYNQVYSYISQQLNQKVKYLSSGQKRILEIFMVLLSGKHIIILDEATNALDFKNKELFLDYVRALSKEGVLFIHTSHDLSEVISLNSISYLLLKSKGKIIRLPDDKRNVNDLSMLIKKEGDLV